MKRYSANTDDWMKRKALGFFVNLINNHQGMVYDNDAFALVSELLSHSEWLSQIQNSFTPQKLSRLLNVKKQQERLDFEDDPQEMLHELWCDVPSRKRIRIMLDNIVAQYLQKKPAVLAATESFSAKVAELQNTLGLSDLEIDILLVLAFVYNNMLTVIDEHSIRNDERAQVVFIAKCLNCDPSEVLAAVTEKSKLRRYNCIDDDFDFNGHLYSFLCGTINEPLANSYFQRDKAEVLPGDFYGDFAKDHGGILQKLIRTGSEASGVNILLYGAPGTGKTEFVKYLGKTLNTKIHIAMGSDLLVMYVGGTEKNIRQAFACAESEKAILFLDEIGGLVQSRERAQRGWEVTQVNELLHQIENFKGVMIGATNFAANLDSAILRRFTFKLEFNFLGNSGKVLFFERIFQAKLDESEKRQLTDIPNLTPGDFRTVRQSLFYLGGDSTNSERISALERESIAKGKNLFAKKQKMGFNA